MSRGVSSLPGSTTFASQLCKPQTSRCQLLPYTVTTRTGSPLSSNTKLEVENDRSFSFWGSSPNLTLRCRSSIRPGGPSSDDGGSRSVLDAFFLGKALAETINERVESVVGEFLSAIGRLQAEQQKQVQDFQEEVLEKAKRAKEKSAREAMEARGLISKTNVDSVTVTSHVPSTTNGAAPSTSLATQYTSPSAGNSEPTTEKIPPLGSSSDD